MAATTLLQAVVSLSGQELLTLALRLAMIGMGTVFSGLLVLSLFLPLIRKIAEGKAVKTASVVAEDGDQPTKDEIVAISTAIHAHLLKMNQMEDMKLTWEMYEKPYSPWRLAGRAKILMDRSATRQRKRSR